jgi:hypothetical protein
MADSRAGPNLGVAVAVELSRPAVAVRGVRGLDDGVARCRGATFEATRGLVADDVLIAGGSTDSEMNGIARPR